VQIAQCVIGRALRNAITCHDFEKTAASSALAKAGSKYLEAVKQNAQSSARNVMRSLNITPLTTAPQ
jgi:hypothetical protein